MNGLYFLNGDVAFCFEKEFDHILESFPCPMTVVSVYVWGVWLGHANTDLRVEMLGPVEWERSLTLAPFIPLHTRENFSELLRQRVNMVLSTGDHLTNLLKFFLKN